MIKISLLDEFLQQSTSTLAFFFFFCAHRRRMLPPPLVQRHVERHGHIQRVVRPVHGDVD